MLAASDIVRIARARAGLSQQQLSDRSGVPRVTIARWETGTREPTLASVQELTRACELDLVIRLSQGDDSLEGLVNDQLQLSPAERIERVLPAEQATEAIRTLRWLAAARTPVVVVGDIAAVLQGAPQQPGDGAVAVVAGDPVGLTGEMADAGFRPTDDDERWAESDRRWRWRCPDGAQIVLASALPGARDHVDLRRSAVEVTFPDDLRLHVAHARDLLRIADASARESDRSRAPGLRALLAHPSASR